MFLFMLFFAIKILRDPPNEFLLDDFKHLKSSIQREKEPILEMLVS